MVAAGGWRFGGGDLPTGSLTLAARADGSVSGEARFIPYTADGARLALDPVRFSGGKGGAMRFATRDELSGPLADGRVRSEERRVGEEVVSTGWSRWAPYYKKKQKNT